MAATSAPDGPRVVLPAASPSPLSSKFATVSSVASATPAGQSLVATLNKARASDLSPAASCSRPKYTWASQTRSACVFSPLADIAMSPTCAGIEAPVTTFEQGARPFPAIDLRGIRPEFLQVVLAGTHARDMEPDHTERVGRGEANRRSKIVGRSLGPAGIELRASTVAIGETQIRCEWPRSNPQSPGSSSL